MPNSILTISQITRESLRVLENNLVFTKGVNREYDDKFGIEGAKIGNTLNIRKPARYQGRTGQVLQVESQTETYVPLTLSTQFGVDVQFTSADLQLSMDDFSQRFLTPALAVVANKIDRDGLALASQVYNTVGTPGTTPATLLPYLQAGAAMDFMAAPRDELRSVVCDPNANASLVNALNTYFNPGKEISDQYKSGNMGRAAGFKFSMDQNIIQQTIGAYLGSPTVNGAGQTGTSLVTAGWTGTIANLLAAGDVFTIAGVYSVNPQSRVSTGRLAQFVVTTQASSSSGAATLAISPAITTSGQFQNVTAAPANGAAITVYGAANTVTPMNLAYHRDAFVFGCADLPLPRGVDMASRVSDKELGISVRMVRSYDIVNDMFPCRLDVLYGWSTVYPELACRIQG
jgi:hypothetical protein